MTRRENANFKTLKMSTSVILSKFSHYSMEQSISTIFNVINQQLDTLKINSSSK